jgi:hypothetical protein
VTRASLREYAAVQRERYQHATRAEKHRLLDEMVAVTGMHRKAAIRLLRRAPRVPTPVARRSAALLWPSRGRGGGGAMAGQWPHRRASPPPVRARVARSARAVRQARLTRRLSHTLGP